ncbi:diaminopimelate decarboxylase [Candidatus Pelagibacter sp.]|nr:diaminopimelate decarboxylase [Candidatus Pelagibacter sp.]
MQYINNKFYIEKKNVKSLAEEFNTPLYCYSFKNLKTNIQNFKKTFKSISPLICFSVKSNSNVYLLKEIKKLGLGADVVSKGELLASLKAGISRNKIVFSGVGKTEEEIEYAIRKNILLINSESLSEVLKIEEIAKKENKLVNIGLRLNPDTDAKTLKQISTGKSENKFGVDEKTFIKIINLMKKSKFIRIKCLSVHIGSQILNHKPYEKMLGVLDKLLKRLKYKFDIIDLGGGMGISYEKNNRKLNYNEYKKSIIKFRRKHNCKIIFEPGRSIIGNVGIIITKVIYLKHNKSKTFVILDVAMNDLIRPALYNAKHRIIPSIKNNSISKKILEFVGPICETTDKFLTEKKYQSIKENDIMIVCDTGAYGYSLSSNYNLRVKPAEVLIKGNKVQIIRKRQKIADII